MTKLNLIVCCFLLAATFSFGQETPTTEKKSNTIEQQFTDLMESSNNYQDFKVVKKTGLERLQKNATDTIAGLKSQIESLQNQLEQRDTTISQLNATLEETENNLEKLSQEKDSLYFLGIEMSKTGYKSLMWAIIALLALALIFFILRYKGSHAHTREAQKKLTDTEYEYEEFRKKALEKEQRMGRLLQDERNKVVKNTKK